ncbi:MAG: hypothetical protein IJT82_01670 [Schwartzia sp.]|nr:hypothetical protein [Schwartzia sp. (in: firmicutes)]
MTDMEIARRVIFSFICAMIIIGIFGNIVGEERKKMWFKARKQTGFFNRRGVLGRSFLFGRPKTKEGLGIALAILGCVAVMTYIIFIV